MCYTVGKGTAAWMPPLIVVFVLCSRRSDGSHQLVRDAVPADSRQGVPQSRPSAARVLAGVRAATPNKPKKKKSLCPKEHTASPSAPVVRLRRIPQCHIKNIPDRSAAVRRCTMLEFSFLFLLFSDGNQIKTEPTDIVRYETAAAPSQNILQGRRVLSILFLSVKRLEITAEGLVRLRLGSRRNTEICNDCFQPLLHDFVELLFGIVFFVVSG